jgi:hypothetical protein
MSVVYSAKDEKFHGFASEIANGCGLGDWQTSSQVVHAVSASPEGPFTRIDVVVPVPSHNPEVLIAPDGTVVVFHLFNGDGDPSKAPKCGGRAQAVGAGAGVNTNKPSGGPSPRSIMKSEPPSLNQKLSTLQPLLRSRGDGCFPVSTPNNCNPGPCWACNISVHTSTDMNAAGPWTRTVTQVTCNARRCTRHTVPALCSKRRHERTLTHHPPTLLPPVRSFLFHDPCVQVIGLANDDGLANYNPTAHVLKNGSIALMCHTNYIYPGWSGLVIAIADTWRGPYYVTVPDRSISNCSKCLEDPFLWVDGRGHWHALVHLMGAGTGGLLGSWSGGHLFSAGQYVPAASHQLFAPISVPI